MKYQKRNKAPKNWPIRRKGSKYVVNCNFNRRMGLPILIILRDLLKIVETKNEAKKVLLSGGILVNKKELKEERAPVSLFDILEIKNMKKSYGMFLSKSGKFELREVLGEKRNQKVSKILNKKILKGNKTQLNFLGGKNILSELKCETNDSALIDLEKNKIKKILPLKKGSEVLVLSGKKIGERGKINEKLEGFVKVQIEEREVKLPMKQIVVIK